MKIEFDMSGFAKKMEMKSWHFLCFVLYAVIAGYGGGIMAVQRHGLHAAGPPFLYFALALGILVFPIFGRQLAKRFPRKSVNAPADSPVVIQ